MENCTFCKIINKEIPSSIVFEDEDVVAFMDVHPANTGHILVLPKKHVQSLLDLDNVFASSLFSVAKNICTAIKKTSIKCEGFSFRMNDGKAAGQEVPHLHLHIIPRFDNDKVQNLQTFERKSKEELDGIVLKIKEYL